jgi:hypothetical protein
MHFVGDVKYHDKLWANSLVDIIGPSYKEWAVEKYAWALAKE